MVGTKTYFGGGSNRNPPPGRSRVLRRNTWDFVPGEVCHSLLDLIASAPAGDAGGGHRSRRGSVQRRQRHTAIDDVEGPPQFMVVHVKR